MKFLCSNWLQDHKTEDESSSGASVSSSFKHSLRSQVDRDIKRRQPAVSRSKDSVLADKDQMDDRRRRQQLLKQQRPQLHGMSPEKLRPRTAKLSTRSSTDLSTLHSVMVTKHSENTEPGARIRITSQI